jgi:hypothetical protein
MLRYLLFTQGAKVNEIRDLPALWVALDKLLKEGADVNPITFGAANGSGSGSSSSLGGFGASMGK